MVLRISIAAMKRIVRFSTMVLDIGRHDLAEELHHVSIFATKSVLRVDRKSVLRR